jgi:hypothetical protein
VIQPDTLEGTRQYLLAGDVLSDGSEVLKVEDLGSDTWRFLTTTTGQRMVHAYARITWRWHDGAWQATTTNPSWAGFASD